MKIDGDKVSVNRNDTIMVPSGTEHGIKNTGNSPLKIMVIWGTEVGEYET